MKLTLNFVQRLMTAGSFSASVFFLAGAFGASGTAQAAPICAGGSVVYDANHKQVGCAFSTWGPSEQSMCNGEPRRDASRKRPRLVVKQYEWEDLRKKYRLRTAPRQ